MPSGSPAASIASASIMALTGPSNAGLSTTVHPAASAAGSFIDALGTGAFHGVIVPTTPTGVRTSRAAPSGVARSSENGKSSRRSAALSHMRRAAAWYDVLAARGAPISVIRASDISARRTSISSLTRRSAAARSFWLIRGHGPRSKASRAAATAASTSAASPSGTWAMISSVVGEMTSMTFELDGVVQWPPMNSLS